jgi:hypothetical protein
MRFHTPFLLHQLYTNAILREKSGTMACASRSRGYVVPDV